MLLRLSYHILNQKWLELHVTVYVFSEMFNGQTDFSLQRGHMIYRTNLIPSSTFCSVARRYGHNEPWQQLKCSLACVLWEYGTLLKKWTKLFHLDDCSGECCLTPHSKLSNWYEGHNCDSHSLIFILKQFSELLSPVWTTLLPVKNNMITLDGSANLSIIFNSSVLKTHSSYNVVTMVCLGLGQHWSRLSTTLTSLNFYLAT